MERAKRMAISIHAPHEGVRRCWPTESTATISFQSTHPTRGCDMLPSSSLLSRLFQSTHPTRGCDCSQIAFNASCFKFQSTHPTRGCDQPGRWTWTTYKHFNPRTPRGGATWILGRPGLQISISIHAPHEGVRLRAGAADKMIIISIHAPHEGVRQEGRG